MLRRHAPHSIARRATGHLDFDGRDWPLGVAALSVGSWWGVRESGGEDFLHHLRVPDYDSAVEGICENFNHSAARVLCSPGVPDSSRGNGFHAAGVHDLLARVALVSYGGSCAVCHEFRLRASVVSGALVVAERGGTVLFSVARRAEEVAPASRCDSAGSCGAGSGVSRGMPFPEAAWKGGRDFSGRG